MSVTKCALMTCKPVLDGLSGQTRLFLLCFAFDVDTIVKPLLWVFVFSRE